MLIGLARKNSLFLNQEALDLCLEGPNIEKSPVLNFFFPCNEGFHEENVVFEVKKLQAQVERNFFLKDID